ncbi:MAG TPA: cobyrinic acid a,c-diamide synthase [Rhodospirillaceae bacterium]|nr:cobyrinic acid a,c-diamide synthase [Rhodospirillaceae bacterium]
MTKPYGLIIAAPASGSGKTILTLGLLRALRNHGTNVAGAKAGPDYIDPEFHAAASGQTAFNLDTWAMRHETISRLLQISAQTADLLIVEGVMGLFDGIHLPERPDAGSTADLAAITGWPVVLVVDAGKQAASVGALVSGFARQRTDVRVAGVIFNRVASDAHATVLHAASRAAAPEVQVLGTVARDSVLTLPERHLGLVHAGELGELERFIETAAVTVTQRVDIEALESLAKPYISEPKSMSSKTTLSPIGQRIAVARDRAFAFSYPATLDGWTALGAEIIPFSPLENEAPDTRADAIYLPGGYPELYAGNLAGADRFLSGLRDAASRGKTIYGECGGYMALGRGLVDADGVRHAMAGLLPVETSFATRRLHLGYRVAQLHETGPLGPAGCHFRGHEFHYATMAGEQSRSPLFRVEDPRGAYLGAYGAVAGTVSGSFIHLIDRAVA